MTKRAAKLFTWAFTFSWPPTWASFQFWRTPCDVKQELQENRRALQLAAEKLRSLRAAIRQITGGDEP